MRLFLIRHGQSVNNTKKIYSGWADTPLTEKGYEEAKALRPILSGIRFDKVYSSDLSRAFNTAKIALPDYEPIRTPLLRECNVGSLENQPWSNQPNCPEEAKAIANSRDFTPLGGENSEMVTHRLKEFFKLLESQDVENVAAFTHGGTILTMFTYVFGQFDHSLIRRPNCMVAVFDYINGRWTVSGIIDPAIFNNSSTANLKENDKF